MPVSNWCWTEKVCVCPSSNIPSVLTTAKGEFSSGYEYARTGDGYHDTDGNKLIEVDCLHLVSKTLELMPDLKPLDLPWFYNSSLLSLIWPNRTTDFLKELCPIPLDDAKKGDLLYFNMVGPDRFDNPLRPDPLANHISIIETNNYNKNIGRGTISHFGAQNPKLGITTVDANVSGGYVHSWSFELKRQVIYELKAYRPKKCYEKGECTFPAKSKNTAKPPVSDPLVLDLDSNGIWTIGDEFGIYFDHDGDGFRELTGWIGQGDGFLMLDRNGNDFLDNGGELFGDSMLLPDGIPTTNGFQALSNYDLNQDGRIDADDPVWSELRVWRYFDYSTDLQSLETLQTLPDEGG